MLNIAGMLIEPEEALLEMDRLDNEESLYEFLRNAWKYIDPSPFVEGWPVEAVAEHLEAVADGEIRRLLINIPPRCAKSSITSVAFPAWVWAQRNRTHTSGPGTQFLTASYAQQLSVRDAVKSRRLIESSWYQNLWKDRFKMSSDQNVKSRFENSEKGVRLSTSVDASNTGEGGNIIIIDDPNNAKEANSEAMIEGAIEWWDGTMSTRLNDPKQGAFVVIQQRLAENDLSGHILEKQADGWTHLCLPMRYEATRSFVTGIGWRDPRTEEGELLWPDRFGPTEVKTLEGQMGPWKSAGQLQQRPEPQGGGIIKRDWWKLWEPATYPEIGYVVASLDTAYTTKSENDFSALTVWGVFSGAQVSPATRYASKAGRMVDMTEAGARFDEAAQVKFPNADMMGSDSPKVIMLSAWAERLELHELVLKVASTCKTLKVDKLLIENKAAGHSVAQEVRRLFSHESWMVQLWDPKGQDKMARLYSVQHLFAEGMVYAPDRPWVEQVIAQVGTFPRGKNDDLVDTVSMGLRHLRDLGLLTRQPEWASEVQESMRHIGAPPPPLYTS